MSSLLDLFKKVLTFDHKSERIWPISESITEIEDRNGNVVPIRVVTHQNGTGYTEPVLQDLNTGDFVTITDDGRVRKASKGEVPFGRIVD